MSMDLGFRRVPTRDHILPSSRIKVLPVALGENLIMVCSGCNNDKGAMFLAEWWAALIYADDERAPHVSAFIQRLLWSMPAEALLLIGLGNEDDYAAASARPSSGLAADDEVDLPLSPPRAIHLPTFTGLPQHSRGA